MKDLKSTSMFENLKPDEEQKKKIYNRIMEQKPEIQDTEIKISEERKPWFRGLALPAAVALMICFTVMAVAGAEKNVPPSDIPAAPMLTEPQVTETAAEEISFSPEKSYRAFVSRDSSQAPKLKTDYGNYVAGVNYERTEYYISALNQTTGEKISILNANGRPLNVIYDAYLYNDEIYIMGADNELVSICVYDKNLQNTGRDLFVTDDRRINSFILSEKYFYVFNNTSGDISKYSMDGDFIESQNVMLQNVNLNAGSDMMLTESGNIVVSADASDSACLLFYDGDLNYIKTEKFPDEYKLNVCRFSKGRIISSDVENNSYIWNITSEDELVPESDIIIESEDENSHFQYSPISDDVYDFYYNINGTKFGYNYDDGKSVMLDDNDYVCFISTEESDFAFANEAVNYYDVIPYPLNDPDINKPVIEIKTDDYMKNITVNDGEKQYPVVIEYPENLNINNIFTTSEDRIMVQFYDNSKVNSFCLMEINPEKGELTEVKTDNFDYLTAINYQPGFGKYSVLYFNERGIYGILKGGKDSDCEKIIDFSKIDFEDSGRYDSKEVKSYINGLYEDETGNLYLEAYKGLTLKLEEK
ncbi:MAG: hypothetical protein Q4D76_10515 [Oscillospiraceae bacterium]|nr:hypothetical protein [Oscillospiraceae bacterium]